MLELEEENRRESGEIAHLLAEITKLKDEPVSRQRCADKREGRTDRRLSENSRRKSDRQPVASTSCWTCWEC